MNEATMVVQDAWREHMAHQHGDHPTGQQEVPPTATDFTEPAEAGTSRYATGEDHNLMYNAKDGNGPESQPDGNGAAAVDMCKQYLFQFQFS